MNISFIADRYQYLAGIGAIVLFAGVVSRATARLPHWTVKAAAFALLVLLGTATWNQSRFYKDNITFFSRSVSVNPESWAAHRYVAGAFFSLGRYAEAENHFRRSVELDPNPADSFLMLAVFSRHCSDTGNHSKLIAWPSRPTRFCPCLCREGRPSFPVAKVRRIHQGHEPGCFPCP